MQFPKSLFHKNAKADANGNFADGPGGHVIANSQEEQDDFGKDYIEGPEFFAAPAPKAPPAPKAAPKAPPAEK